ncbi:flagellin [Sphingomonas quercus]|uniref:Flagellin n=1 Tax=Sphingomonas quercus TaxID=2842451 RepID=A0ABS6BLM5_9SPHN|nr:flagellin [Sphingomonas quercus]MBU3078671.1 flagellin [Sphingomonas quercus]
MPSVNTNVGAMAALQVLNATNRSLETTQSRINTGLNVASTKDDSAKYTIAQQLRGDVGGLASVTSSLNNAKSVSDVAVSGTEQISDILNKMKALVAQSEGTDAESTARIGKDFQAYQNQIENIITSSGFNGINLLASPNSTGGGSSTTALISLQGGDGDSTTWDFEKLSLDNVDLSTKLASVLGGSAEWAAAGSVKMEHLEDAFGEVQDVLSTLGANARRIDDQLVFTSKLSDTITSGIGNLVDADLAKESASLQALQVKQQLGVQALSIANQAPQTLLSLFR